jgi:hypothetical protein
VRGSRSRQFLSLFARWFRQGCKQRFLAVFVLFARIFVYVICSHHASVPRKEDL